MQSYAPASTAVGRATPASFRGVSAPLCTDKTDPVCSVLDGSRQSVAPLAEAQEAGCSHLERGQRGPLRVATKYPHTNCGYGSSSGSTFHAPFKKLELRCAILR